MVKRFMPMVAVSSGIPAMVALALVVARCLAAWFHCYHVAPVLLVHTDRAAGARVGGVASALFRQADSASFDCARAQARIPHIWRIVKEHRVRRASPYRQQQYSTISGITSNLYRIYFSAGGNYFIRGTNYQ